MPFDAQMRSATSLTGCAPVENHDPPRAPLRQHVRPLLGQNRQDDFDTGFGIYLYTKTMRHEFVDRFCRTLPEAIRDQPFGPDMVVWKIHGHMFAAYTETGAGLSVRTAGMSHALAMIRRSRPVSAPYLTGGAWVVLPWETTPEELRVRLRESYDLVLRDWPTTSTASRHQSADQD